MICYYMNNLDRFRMYFEQTNKLIHTINVYMVADIALLIYLLLAICSFFFFFFGNHRNQI